MVNWPCILPTARWSFKSSKTVTIQRSAKNISKFKKIMNRLHLCTLKRTFAWLTIRVINPCMMICNVKIGWSNSVFQLLITSSVDGNWGAWSSYGKCSTTCGSGTQMRRRNCDRPPMSNGGKRCAGSATEKRICSVRECPGTGKFRHKTYCWIYHLLYC